MLKLNLGCGDKTPEGWINVDYALGAWLFRVPGFSFVNKKLNLFNITWSDSIFLHDLRKKLPWEDNSIDVVYSSHTLEHLFESEGRELLNECYRTLKPNGLIRIVVPDLQSIVDRYERNEISAPEVLDVLCVHYYRPHDKLLKKFLAPILSFPHKCMYDTASLVEIMSDIGFQVESKSSLESDIANLDEIEDLGRTMNAVIVEGKKKIDSFQQDELVVSEKLSVF